MTWNLWWRFGPWEARQPGILATIRQVDPDIVCIQETWEARDGESQPRALADALGYHYAHVEGLGLDLAPESFGNAVLSRWPITASEGRPLGAPEGLNELRSMLRSEIDGPRGPIEVFCTHLNWRLDQSHVRQQQLRDVCAFIAETHHQRTYPPILCGDLNAEPMSDEIRMLTGFAEPAVEELVFLDAWRSAGDDSPGFTWSRDNPFTAAESTPDARIDYVLVGHLPDDASGEPLACRVEGAQPVDGVQPSDHYAVVAELRY